MRGVVASGKKGDTAFFPNQLLKRKQILLSPRCVVKLFFHLGEKCVFGDDLRCGVMHSPLFASALIPEKVQRSIGGKAKAFHQDASRAIHELPGLELLLGQR